MYCSDVAGRCLRERQRIAHASRRERFGETIPAYLRSLPRNAKPLSNTGRSQREAARRLSIVRAGIGEARDARTLSENDIRQYEARRRTGGVRYGKDAVTGKVRQRSLQADIKLLKQVRYWHARSRTPTGVGCSSAKWLTCLNVAVATPEIELETLLIPCHFGFRRRAITHPFAG